MRKSFTPWMILLFIVCLLPQMANAASNQGTGEPIRLIVEGKSVETDAPPMIEKGRTLVPIRVIAEELGARVIWDDKARTASIERDQTRLELTLGRAVAKQNGKDVKLDTPPTVKNGRMLLPLRYVSEALGLTVGWDHASRTVVVNTPIRVELNNGKVSPALKAYLLDGSVYLPVDGLADQFGLKDWIGKNPPQQTKTIDSARVAPIERLASLLNADIDWKREDHRISIYRENRLSGIQLEGNTLRFDTSNRISPANFRLEGPHRIVLDFPHTVLSDKLRSDMNGGYQGIAYQAPLTDSEGKNRSANTDVSGSVSGKGVMPDWLRVGGEQEQQTEELPVDLIASLEPAASLDSADEPLVTSVRYSQYQDSPAVVRVVVELSQKADYQLIQRDDGVELKLNAVPRKTGYLIVVDAGHGGHDRGATGVAGNAEKDYNLAVANKVVALLSKYPEFQVVATRSTDVYLTLKERADMANKLQADLFLSIHANAFKPTTRGTETFYYNANSESFARIVHKHLVKATGFPDRKVQKQPFYVIKNTTMPAALTETGFLTNSFENSQLMSPAFQDKVAQALVAAIREYYEKFQ